MLGNPMQKKLPLLLQYAELETRVNENWLVYGAALPMIEFLEKRVKKINKIF